MDGAGDLLLNRETRGAVAEWGGVYAQLVRLAGAWQVGVEGPGGVYTLPASLTRAELADGRWRSEHRMGEIDLVQEVLALGEPAGALRRFRVSVGGGTRTRLRVTSRFRPYLLPVLVEGIVPTSFHVESHPTELRAHQRGFALRFSSSVAPSGLLLNRSPWPGGHYEGRVEEIASVHDLDVPAGTTGEISFLLVGGLERDAFRAPATAFEALDAGALSARAVSDEAAWLARTPEMRLPQAPELERGYRLARSALRRLYAEPGDGLVGLVAGYPWYSAIWCRDLAWMLPAVVWLGDPEWAERSIESVLRFQSRSEVPILGGEPGELPMQLAPGPLFLYGTSDTTLYFPDLVRRLVRHTGRVDLVARWGTAIERMIAWGAARTDPESGLLRNGGEAEAISAATGGLARVRYGIDAPDTTIWDSADRRDHAIDVQVLWHQALDAAAELLEEGPEDPRAARWRRGRDRVAEAVRTRYPWSQEGYLYDSFRNGSAVPHLRPNALRAVSAVLLDREQARSVVRRASQEDLTTDWGVRTLSARDAEYRPLAYHDGQVWPIATAWAADAAFAVGDRELGLRYLGMIAGQLEREGGLLNECYRGDRPEAFDSCFLLGFSVAPFLTALFERLWGLTVDARRPALSVFPAFPANWSSASLERLAVGTGRVSLAWERGRLDVHWSGPGPLELRTASQTTIVAPGAPVAVVAEVLPATEAGPPPS